MGETRALNAGSFSEPVEADAVSGQLMSLHAGRLHDAGISFDPRLAPYFGEETDLALKIKRSGYKVYGVPESEFEHTWGISRHDRPIFCFGRRVNRMRCIVHNKLLLRRKIDAYLQEDS
jgi:GT2 family glycosyltransferase